MKAIVIGAGLAGLSAAYRLKQAGWQVEVLEASYSLGGRAATVRHGRYLFDSGAVGIGTVYRDYMRLVHELGLDDKIVRASTVTATLRGGRLHEIDAARPLRAGLLSRLLSWPSKLRMVNLFTDLRKVRARLDIRDVSAAADLDDESAAEYASRRLNAELLEYFINPMLRTLNLSRAERISKLELMNALSGLFDTELVALLGGIAQLPEALAAQLSVRLGCCVTHVEKHSDRVDLAFQEGGQQCQMSADAVVVATTLPQAVALYPACHAALASLVDAVHYNRGLCVHLGYRRRTVTKALMVMLPVSESPEIALLFLEHNKAPDRAPDDSSMITLFFDDVAIDGPWHQSDDRLIESASAFVESVLPELAGHREMAQVTRWPLGLTHPGVGIYRRMRQSRLALDATSRVQLAGDYWSTAGQNSAIVYGEQAARNLMEHFH